MTHTPTPWETYVNPNTHDAWTWISTPSGTKAVAKVFGAGSYEGDANAEFIVRAVNYHDTLVSELQEAQAIIHRLWEMTQNYNIPDSAHWPYMRERERLDALAKAKEA